MPEAWKTVRVFISSTFRDMQAERDHLVRFVFPRLRQQLSKRRIHLVDVDLRWGVTGDQDAFDLCMDEIDRCRPRFICMLGGRYGWVPAPRTIRRGAFEKVISGGDSLTRKLERHESQLLNQMYALNADDNSYHLSTKPEAGPDLARWNQSCEALVEILQRAHIAEAQFSITASEIHYGALDKLDDPIFRYFYFRKPDVTESIPDQYASDYREPKNSFAATALSELKEKIKNLSGKVIQTGISLSSDRQIIDAPLPVFEYSCRWEEETKRIVGLHEFGSRVYEQILESIDAEFGLATSEVLDEYAEEDAAMEAFVETRVERYVVGSRQGVFDKLLQHAQAIDGNGYLCLVGEPGSGKSALLGKFYRDYSNVATGGPNSLVIPHFVGASAASANARQLLRRVCQHLAVAIGITDEIPDDFDKLREAFGKFLEQAARTKHTLIMIDAINQMDAAHDAHSMRWLPVTLPANSRVIMTTLPGQALESLRTRRQPPIEVTLRSLNESDATAIVDEYLSRYRKSFDNHQRSSLLRKSGSRTPLYLLTALEELRTLGTYEEITQRINDLPEETRPLFTWILERLERDDGFRDASGKRIGAEVVSHYCSYLAVGRSGMAQSELVELIVPASDDKDYDAEGNVAALQRLLRPYLMQRGELLDFFHGQLREAVEEKYLANDEQRVTANKAVAGYFQSKTDPKGDGSWSGDYPRGLSELPYHQTEAQMWSDVHKTLTDLGFLEAKCTHVSVGTSGTGPGARKIYGGVYELQEDYRRAIEKIPQ